MNIFKIIIFIILFVSGSNKSFSQDTIHWKADYKLKWDDYKATPDENINHDAISTINVTYQLSLNKNGYRFKVFCAFNKTESWVKQKDSILLKHEQGHFDIHELFARKLRKEFKTYKFNLSTIKSDFQRLFEKITQQSKTMNKLYDKETNFSKNRKMQEYWKKKIAQELKKLEQFKQQ